MGYGIVKLAFYTGKGEVGNYLIRLWTKRQESHCEVVIGGFAYSSSLMDGGVRKKKIEFNTPSWEIIDVPWGSEEYALQHYEATKDNKYGWWGLLGSQIFNRASNEEKADFCSEWCASALGIPNATLYNPGTLKDLIHYLNMKHK